MPVTNPEKNVTVKGVETELADLETKYRARKRALRALLAVLKQEDQPAEETEK